jgi:transaldolase
MNKNNLRTKIFSDCADLDTIIELSKDAGIRGFTTNPTLMRKAGISDYEAFARDALQVVTDRPLSLEVFADDLPEMEAQARIIASWGPNVNVKIPVTNTRREFTGPIVKRLASEGVIVNVTALMTVDQVRAVTECLSPDVPAFVSVFAGRVADTGRDPLPLMRAAVEVLRQRPQAELIWASPREVLNIVHADSIGCHVITVTRDLLAKLSLFGKDLDDYSLETVEMFYRDASKAGYQIAPAVQRYVA